MRDVLVVRLPGITDIPEQSYEDERLDADGGPTQVTVAEADRVDPSALSATPMGIDGPWSYSAECNAPPIGGMIILSPSRSAKCSLRAGLSLLQCNLMSLLTLIFKPSGLLRH